jgi:membrane-associated phospholipid phosphatase
MAVLAAAGGLWALDIVWAGWAGISLLEIGTLIATLVVLGANLVVYGRMQGGERAFELAWTVAIFVTLGTGFTLLSYLGLTLHMPLADPWFAWFDAMLGFDWTAWFDFVHHHALLTRLLVFAYRTLALQLVITIFALPLSGMTQRTQEFLWASAIDLLITVVLAALLPAESAWVWHHAVEQVAPGPWQDFQAMRAGSLAMLDLQQLRGLVTFPSFHVSAAVLLAWAARGTRFAFLSLVLNLLMIVSTLSEGGHYLADVVGGLAVAAVAIAAAHRLRAIA